MKRRIVFMTVLAGCLACATFAPYAEQKGESVAETATEAETAEAVEADEEPEFNPADYVEIGDYEGLEIEVSEKAEVTDEDVEAEIAGQIEEKGLYEESDRKTAEDGDVVNIDYVGRIDGEEFDGGSDKGTKLTLGSGDFIEGFEEQIVGKEIGETFDVTVTFPDDYYEELAGKEAVFEVTLNAIENPRALDDETASLLSDGEYGTADEYRESVRKHLEEHAENDRLAEAREAVQEQLLNVCEIKGYPKEVVDYRVAEEIEYYKQYAEELGETYEQLLSDGFGMTEEELKDEMRMEVEDSLGREMIADLIAEKENVSVEEDDFRKYVEELAEQMWYPSAEELIAEFGEDFLMKQFRRDKAMDAVAAKAKITEVERTDEDYELNLEDLGLEFETEDYEDAENAEDAFEVEFETEDEDAD